MRRLLVSSLLSADIVGNRVFALGASGFQDVPADPDFPYIIVSEQTSIVHREVWKTARSTSHLFRVFIYDEIGSFVLIDDILSQVRETVLGLTLAQSPSGKVCTQANWTGQSGDIADSEGKQNIKYGDMSMLSNG